MAFYIGVDIGGTNINVGVTDGTGNIVGEAEMPTGANRPQEAVISNILYFPNTPYCTRWHFLYGFF